MNAFIETRPARVGFALLPPLVAWAVQSLLWAQVKPSVWIFFYPAVFFSSLLGGRMSGLVATVVSTAIVWLAFVIPEGGFEPRFGVQAGVFLVMGVCFAVFNGRLRAAHDDLEKRARERTEDLESAITTLRQRKAELSMVTETARVGMVIVDAQHRYRFANRVYGEILGLPKNDLMGRRVADVLPAAYASQIRPRLERAFAGEHVEYLLHLPSNEGAGDGRHFSVSYAPAMDGDERVVVVVIADVTASKRSEEVSARLAAIVTSSSDAIIGKDLTGVVTSWNAGAEAVFGYKAEEMVGRSISRLIPEERSDEERVILESIARGENVRHFETQRRHADGRLLDVSITVSPIRDRTGKIVGASKVARDVSEAKRVGQALRESEERLRLAIDAARLGMWESDYRTGRLRWSPRQEEMMGFAPGEFPGTLDAFQALVHPEDLGLLAEAQRKALAAEGNYQAELRFVRRNGRVRWGLLRGRMVVGADGKPERMIGIELDVTERRLAEDALRESEAQFRTLVNLSPDAVFIVQDNRVVYMNRRGLALWRAKSEADVLGMNPVERIHADWREAVRERIARLVTDGGTAAPLELKIVALDGTPIEVETIGAAFEYRGAPAIQVIMRDITERKRAEETLHTHRAILEETGRVAKVGGWSFDPVTGEGYWTDEVARIHDLDPADATSRNIGLRYYTEGSRAVIEAAVQAAVERAVPYDLELELLSAAGVRKWVHTIGHPAVENGRVVRVHGSFQDITEQKRAERRLQLQANVGRVLVAAPSRGAAMRGVLEAIATSEQWQFGAVWAPDAGSGRVGCEETWGEPGRELAKLEASSRAWKFGPGEGLPGMVWERKTVVFVPDVTAEPNYLRRDLAAGAGMRSAVAFPVLIENEVVAVVDFLAVKVAADDAALVPTLEVLGRQIGLFLQRSAAEEHVRALNTELEQRVARRTAELEAANKELEAFSYTVSHDLRAPLRAINGFSLAVQEDYGAQLPEEGRRFLQNVRDGALRMGNLIDDLLTFSRLSRLPLSRQTVDSVATVNDALTELGWPLAGRKIELRIEELPPSDADPVLLKQVWVNLLSNALKYTRKRAQARVEVGCRIEGGEPVFFVRDNGSGFDPRYAHKLFGVFQRLHRAEDYEGTGVGLAIVQRIVHRHGGRVWAETKLEVGSSFFFTLKSAQSP
jgi:PAS domain S-box-containing protein